MIQFRGTTIIGVKKDGKIVLAGDGQVTAGEHTIFKGNARKVRRIKGCLKVYKNFRKAGNCCVWKPFKSVATSDGRLLDSGLQCSHGKYPASCNGFGPWRSMVWNSSTEKS